MNESGADAERLWQELRRHKITDARLLAALAAVPRERFVRPEQQADAYRNAPLPIGEGQTISQPYVVAFMLQELHIGGHEQVLEVGTGSGYQTALLAHLALEVVSVERHASLAELARQRLAELELTNVQVEVGDGTLGWPIRAPYDAIVVSAGAPDVPPQLIGQLAIGGRLILPVGDLESQELVLITRTTNGIRREQRGLVRFVPLVGEEGWAGSEQQN
jgi:protein-L-isoaspartate(D-aspartate) O-methyltransferase